MHRDGTSDSQRRSTGPVVAPSVLRLIYISGGILLTSIGLLWSISGRDEATRGLIATAICVPLAAISLALSGCALPRGFNWQFGVIVGGAGIRMGLVLLMSGVFFSFVPICGRVGFWIWIVCAYLLTLSTEIILLIQMLHRWSQMNPPASGNSGDGQVG